MAQGGVFINYRRHGDVVHATGRIYERLVEAYGRDRVFKDVDDIPLGESFDAFITQRISACDVLLVIIGPQWLTVTEDGRRRIDDPEDWVRKEIEIGLASPTVQVVPVLVDDATLPPEVALPLSLRPLLTKHAAKVGRDPDFHPHMDRLIRDLPLPPIRRPRAGRVALGGGLAALVLGLVGLGSVYLVWLRTPSWPATTEAGRPLVRLGTKDFVESSVLAEILRWQLERDCASEGLVVEVAHNTGDTLRTYAALEQQRIHGYVEYTATLLLHRLTGVTAEDVLALPAAPDHVARINEALGSTAGLRAWPALGFRSDFGLVTTPEGRARLQTLACMPPGQTRVTLAHLAACGVHVALFANPDFLFERDDGRLGLREAPHHFDPGQLRPVRDQESKYAAFLEHDVAETGLVPVMDAWTTDWQRVRYSDRIVEVEVDDFWPPYFAFPLTLASLGELPCVAKALDGLHDRIPLIDVQELNEAAQTCGIHPEGLARDDTFQLVELRKLVDAKLALDHGRFAAEVERCRRLPTRD